jgi:hypothetical protein
LRDAPIPFALSLSKGCPSFGAIEGEGQGFDKLSPNGRDVIF